MRRSFSLKNADNWPHIITKYHHRHPHEKKVRVLARRFAQLCAEQPLPFPLYSPFQNATQLCLDLLRSVLVQLSDKNRLESLKGDRQPIAQQRQHAYKLGRF